MADGEVFVIVEIKEILDQTVLQAYLLGSREKVQAQNGVMVARDAKVFEGEALNGPMIVQRWPSEQAFRDWQDSEDYRPLREIRRRAAKFRITIVPLV